MIDKFRISTLFTLEIDFGSDQRHILISPDNIIYHSMRYMLCANWSVISLVEVPGRELHTTSFVNTARTTRKVMRNVTRRGNVLEELARRMRPTRIVDLTTT